MQNAFQRYGSSIGTSSIMPPNFRRATAPKRLGRAGRRLLKWPLEIHEHEGIHRPGHLQVIAGNRRSVGLGKYRLGKLAVITAHQGGQTGIGKLRIHRMNILIGRPVQSKRDCPPQALTHQCRIDLLHDRQQGPGNARRVKKVKLPMAPPRIGIAGRFSQQVKGRHDGLAGRGWLTGVRARATVPMA